MDKYQQTINTWNKLADIYEQKFMDITLYNTTYDYFCDNIKKNDASILELGCGPGNITQYIQNKRPDFNILATDVSPNMIEKAKQNIPTAQFMVKDIRDITSIEQKFDGILCGFCIPFIDTKEVSKFLDYSLDALNKYGWLYLSFVDGETHQSEYKSGSTGDRIYFHYHSLEQILKKLKVLGFNNSKIFVVDYHKGDTNEEHTIVVAQRP